MELATLEAPPSRLIAAYAGGLQLKALIRRTVARTYDDLWRTVGHVCDLFFDEECYNFFKAAGYETN